MRSDREKIHSTMRVATDLRFADRWPSKYSTIEDRKQVVVNDARRAIWSIALYLADSTPLRDSSSRVAEATVFFAMNLSNPESFFSVNNTAIDG
jgi:hypothetical protein